MAKYFGFESRQDLIERIEETQVYLYYKNSSYLFYLDGRGHNFVMASFDGKSLHGEEMEKTRIAAETVPELIDKAILYDGVPLSEAIEMDTDDWK